MKVEALHVSAKEVQGNQTQLSLWDFWTFHVSQIQSCILLLEVGSQLYPRVTWNISICSPRVVVSNSW